MKHETLNPYLSIVIPLFNEEESVVPLVEKVTSILNDGKIYYELILVDDGSTDRTWQKLKHLKNQYPQIVGIKFRRNFGQTAAMVAGFDNARGKFIVTMDGDLQNDPSDIPRMLKLMEDKKCDIVSGWRKDRKDNFSRVLPSRIANFIISRTTGVHLHDYGCSLKIYRADCIRSIKAYGEMHRFFPALASMTGARVTELPVDHYPRRYGKSKYGFDRILKVFSDIFAMNLIIRFSTTPLKGFALIATPFASSTLFFGIMAILAYIFDWTAGKALFFFIASALMAMASVHLIGIGIIGELVVHTSDLSHAQLPEMTKKVIEVQN
jgi:glycosyltransferase involved in cell wall biosynthesis